MSESELIRFQVNRTVTLLKANITRYYDALHELKRLTLLLLADKKHSQEDINNWFEREGFGVDDDGFWLSIPLLERFRAGKAPEDAISHSWNPKIRDHEDACFRMFCLKDIGPFVKDIHSRLPGSAWIYYQDVTNTSIQFPYIDQATAITPDFDWSAYHTYVSVAPRVNPERVIRWTQPSVDYAGEGVILSVSIPVYFNDAFIGAWSIDLPIITLYQDYISESYVTGQDNLIFDRQGNIIVHPCIEARIDKSKGSLYQQKIGVLGGDFIHLEPEKLIRDKVGEMRMKGGNGKELLAYYGTVPDLQWTFFVTVPRSSMLDAVNRRIKSAFDKIMEGDLSYRLDSHQERGQQSLLIDGYNDMAAALQLQAEIRLQAENALRESERKYRLLFQNASDGIFVIKEGKIIFANPRTLEITGYSEKELERIEIEDLLQPEYREIAFEHHRKTLKQSSPENCTVKIKNKSRVELWIQLNSVRIFWEGEQATLNFARDVTKQVKLEHQLHHAQKIDAIGTLTSSLAHEFGNPLMGMRFAMQDIQQRPYLDKEDAKLLSLAEKECNRMRELIRDLQLFSRPTSGCKSSFSLHQLLDDLLIFHRRILVLNEVRIIRHYDERDIFITAVEDQLRQVFINLIFNANDAMKEIGGELTVATKLHADTVTISFGDNGVGIEPDSLAHIFEPFYTTKSEVEGIGLGLSVSYGILRAHKGQITVESKPGNTVFKVSLPL